MSPNLATRKFLFVASLLLPVLFVIYSFSFQRGHHAYQAEGELPFLYNDLFAGSGNCLLCHNEQVDQSGDSISIISDWRSGMMANAVRDPFWRAKVSHEGLVNPGHKEALEDVCTRCHAPTGNKNAHYLGQPLYSIEEMQNDPLAVDGVQCTVCHQITESTLGSFSGTFEVGNQKQLFGPYENPLTTPMINNIGYTPVHSPHINDSRTCASCHTLITNSVDNNGQPTGNEFVEQSIYQEWENSSYPANDVHCATCHVPRIDDVVKISNRPPWLEGRTPFGMHHFQGANALITAMLKEHGEELAVTASDEQFDSTIIRNLRSLQLNSLSIELQETGRTDDTLFVDLQMLNLSGHKFPGGYPSRRFFVELLVKDENDQLIFHSGAMDEDFQIIEEDLTYEPHYDIINSDDEVQIYEMVMGDINYEVTTVLERANFQLKDNRIPPNGFTTTHYAYDTVAIVGQATADANFNKINSTEGSGSDLLHFHIPTGGNQETLTVDVKIHYQSVSSKWLEHMFTYSSDEIDRFKGYYESADLTPVLVASDAITSQAVSINKLPDDGLLIFPNPTRSRIICKAKNQSISEIIVFDSQGRKQDSFDSISSDNGIIELDLPYPDGIYFLKFISAEGVFSRKIILH